MLAEKFEQAGQSLEEHEKNCNGHLLTSLDGSTYMVICWSCHQFWYAYNVPGANPPDSTIIEIARRCFGKPSAEPACCQCGRKGIKLLRLDGLRICRRCKAANPFLNFSDTGRFEPASSA